MPDIHKEDKTEKATGKRREDARKKGNIPHSQEIDMVVMFLGSITDLKYLGPHMRDNIMMEFKEIMGFINYPFTADNLNGFLSKVLIDTFKIVFPILCVILLISFIGNWAQVGNLWAVSLLKPKLSNLKPKFAELKPINKDKAVKLFADIGKLCVIIPIAYYTVISEINTEVLLIDQSISQLFNFICMMVYKVVVRISLALLFIAGLDYLYRRWKHEEDIKMTKQEVKDERKNIDQDPHIKGKIRSLGREMMRKLMYKEIPSADVVITNPTHIAVALKYDPASMSAPKVVAKGARLIAEKIKSIAGENKIPIVENKPLARILYKTVDIGGEIPPDLYKAVAEILAYVYKLNKKRAPGFSY